MTAAIFLTQPGVINSPKANHNDSILLKLNTLIPDNYNKFFLVVGTDVVVVAAAAVLFS